MTLGKLLHLFEFEVPYLESEDKSGTASWGHCEGERRNAYKIARLAQSKHTLLTSQ